MTPQQEDHLALARRHVAEGEQRVAHQVGHIATLTRAGHDTTDAEALLVTLQEILATMYTHLHLLENEHAAGLR